MRLRLAAGRSLVRLGRFIQSLAVAVMAPRDILDLTRSTYSSPASVAGWSEPGVVDAGLSADEAALLEKAPVKTGELLLLGIGGGREAVPLASRGFRVTGVDSVPALAARAEENLRQRGFAVRTLVQDITRLDLPAAAFDLAWLTSGGFYSTIPSRRLRLEALGRIRRALKPGGCFVCQFLLAAGPAPGRGERLRRFVSRLSRGDRSYEAGDTLLDGAEFAHHFAGPAEVRAEFEEAGFRVLHLMVPASGSVGGAVLGKDGIS